MKLSTPGATIAALALCAVAGAQNSPYQQIGASVRIGAFFPTNSSTNDDIGSGFFTFGVGYRLFNPPRAEALTRKTNLLLTVDYYRRSNFGDTPILLNATYRNSRLTYFVGAGVGFESLPSHSKTGFAYAVGVDYDLPSTSELPIFLEAKFLGADRSEVNGVGVYAGIRF